MGTRARRRIEKFIAAGLVGVLPLIGACGRTVTPADFDEQRARAHVDALAGTIGSRPIGSAANARAREYLVGVLKEMGFEVRLQQAEGMDDRVGLRRVTAPAVNIIARRDGISRDAVALVSHYDSVPEGPGALDDALGVSVCLEAARRLSAEPRRHSLFVIITDGEEVGLIGARAAVQDPEIASRVRAFLNFDGTGAAGPLLMFETGPGRGSALEAWADASPSPEGASFTTEIYRRLPNDTDFTAFKTIEGVSGVNFAPVLDSYGYHTDRDVPERVQTATLRQGTLNTIAIVRALDRRDLSVHAGLPTYFSLFGRFVVVFGAVTTAVVAWAGIVFAIVAWIILWILAHRAIGKFRALMTVLWSWCTAAAALGAGIGATALLRVVRDQLNPWYADPQWYFMWLMAAGVAAAWLVRRAAAVVPERVRPWSSSMAPWLAALPIWALVTGVAVRLAPGASYLFSIPLVGAGYLIATIRDYGIPGLRLGHRLNRSPWPTEGRVRLASFLVFVVAASLWVSNLSMLLRFLVAMFGWFPVVAPAWMFPAAMGVGALMVVPPLAGTTGRMFRAMLSGRAAGAVVGLVLITTGVAAYRAPAFTEGRPQVRSARYVWDGPRGEAWWEVASLEPALNLDGGPAGAEWQPATEPLKTSASLILRRPARFVFRARGEFRSDDAPPIDVASTVRDAEPGRVAFDVTIGVHGTRGPALVELALPPGITPIESSLRGGPGPEGTWRAAYVSPPPEGLHMHLVLPDTARDALKHAVVTLQVPGVPGGTTSDRLPDWLPRVATSWRAYSWYLVSAAPASVAR